MRHELEVVVSEDTGIPFAEVPSECMWDLIEYISYQRVVAHYDYHLSHFTVSFPRLSAAVVQEILDSWGRRTYEMA